MTANKPKIYLLDIEGTVAPVSLVTEQLFPYARTHASEFIVRNLSVRRVCRDVQSDLVLRGEGQSGRRMKPIRLSTPSGLSS